MIELTSHSDIFLRIINVKVEHQITQKLIEAFAPTALYVENESHRHNVPPGSESHFKVTVVSDVFEGKRLLACHRMINEVLKDELEHDIHALAIHTYTQQKWESIEQTPDSPNCMGGTGK
jgi:BolA family transcriptional regulator, general stress-responsive regulator